VSSDVTGQRVLGLVTLISELSAAPGAGIAMAFKLIEATQVTLARRNRTAPGGARPCRREV
jgi:hypothetical protein